MATPIVSQPSGVNAGGPAAAFLTSNSKVRSQTGFLGLQTDVVQFSGPMATGTWVTGATRVFVQQVPVVLQSSTGTAVSPAPASVPMTVVMGDARVSGA
jgi:hypothetical protein